MSGYPGFDGHMYSAADMKRGRRGVMRVCKWKGDPESMVLGWEAIAWLDDQRQPAWRTMQKPKPKRPRTADELWDNRRGSGG